MINGNIISLRNLGSEMAKILTDKVRVRCRILWPTGFEDVPYEIWSFMRPILCIIYLIIKIVIIDWSKLNHATRRKSTYHCLEGLGVLSFDLRSNDSTPKPCDRSSNSSATFAHTYHCFVTMVAMSCCAICALFLLCRAEFQCNSL